MKVEKKFSFHPATIIILFSVFINLISCKRDQLLPVPESPPKGVLSKNSPDFDFRLRAIREKFYSEKLEQKFVPNVNQKIIWTPDWNHPNTQVVNDSVSYVFYRLTAQLKKDGKLLEAKETGAASYLMVKNEKEFYKAFYYAPTGAQSGAAPTELSISNFTGNLLLTNLQNKTSFLLEYVDGKISPSYQKKTVSSG